jgi:serine protease Do
VQTFDPAKRRYTVERYLMAADAMDKARTVRSQYRASGCQSDPAARQSVSDMQAAIRQTLPPSPNERLVFDCRAAPKP